MQNVLPYLFETYQHPKTRHPTCYSGLPFVTYYAIKSYLPFFLVLVIVFILFHQTSAHLYAKEKPQMSDSYLRLWMPVLWLFSSFTTDLTDWTDWTDLRCVVTVLL